MESHILQVKDTAMSDEEDKFLQDIFKVFATKKKKCGAKAPELSAPPPAARAPTSPPLPPTLQTPPTAASNSCPNTQYWYHCNTKEQHLVMELEDYLLQGKLSNTTPAHVFAASPAICKNIAKKIRVRQVESNEYKLARPNDLQLPPPPAQRTTVHKELCDHQPAAIAHPSTFCLPLQEIDILINGSLKVPAILDTSSQITVICRDIAQSLGLHINNQRLIEMEGANGATNWMVGCTENLTLQVGDVSFTAHVHVIEHTSFELLLGRPFQQAAQCRFEDLPSGEVEVSMQDPTNLSRRVFLTTRPCIRCTPSFKLLSVLNHVSLSLLPKLAAT